MHARITPSLILLVAIGVGVDGLSFPVTPKCRLTVKKCRAHFAGIKENFQKDTFEDLKKACQFSESAEACMGKCFHQYMQSNIEARKQVKILEYACTPEKLEEYKALSADKCVTDKEMRDKIEEGGEMCQEAMKRRMSDPVFRMESLATNNEDMSSWLCPLMFEMLDCYIHRVEEICSKEYSTYFVQIVKTSFKEDLFYALPVCLDYIKLKR